jgi:ribonuclease HI
MAGQYTVDELQKELNNLLAQNKNTLTTLRWVPRHKGNAGNEQADEEAKQAMWGLNSPSHILPKLLKRDLPINKSATL